MMPIRILPQVLHLLENKEKFFTYIPCCASPHRFILLVNVVLVGDIVFNIFGQYIEMK